MWSRRQKSDHQRGRSPDAGDCISLQSSSDVGVDVRLDRLIVLSWGKAGFGRGFPKISGFRVVRDTRVRPQGRVKTYGRVRELASRISNTRLFWQYEAGPGWLKDWRITIIGDDLTGIRPDEVFRILKRCRYAWLSLVELAFDFDPQTGVTRTFVQKHGHFGKSQFRPDRGGPGQRRYGTRKSGKLIRCYWKSAVNAYRVEVEVHSRLLYRGRRTRISEGSAGLTQDLASVPYLICPKHFCFVRFNWEALRTYLRRRFGTEGNTIARMAKQKAGISLRRASGFLRRKGIRNVHRFLVSMRINRAVKKALTKWATKFREYFDQHTV